MANGFIPEVRNSYGWAKGTGFATENRWGQYTAYLMLTSPEGYRTWRLEHYLPWTPGPYVSANPAKATEGVNDLKTVVRYLLSHENDGKTRANPLDFVVAITHNHPDHIGENKRMADRTIYYPGLRLARESTTQPRSNSRRRRPYQPRQRHGGEPD